MKTKILVVATLGLVFSLCIWPQNHKSFDTPPVQSLPTASTKTDTKDSPTAAQSAPQTKTSPQAINLPTPKAEPSQQTTIRTNQPEAVVAAAKQQGLPVGYVSTLGDGSIVVIDAKPNSAEIASLQAQVSGLVIAPNYRYSPAQSANDTFYGSQWALQKISMPSAWDITTGSSDVTLAVIDSGVLFSQTINGTTYSQSDFPLSRLKVNAGEQGNTQVGDSCWTGVPADKSSNACDDDENGYIDDWRGWDFMGGFRGSSAACPNHNDTTTYQDPDYANYLLGDNDPQPYSCDSPNDQSALNKTHYNGTCTQFVSACSVGHGTQVASVAAATTNNNTHVAGMDQQAKIMNLRIFDGYGFTDSARIAAAVLYAANNGADVINMSLGFDPCTPGFVDNTVEAALLTAKNAGVTIVVASGNANTSNVCYPASSSRVIGVGATDSNDHRSSFSSYGSDLDVAAPGSGIHAANAPTSYANADVVSVNGTSFAAPHVAGLATLIKALDPYATPDEVSSYILKRSDLTGDMNWRPYTNQFGFGRINAYTTLRTVTGQLPVYRLGNPYSSEHFYTTDIDLRNSLMDTYKILYPEIYYWQNDGSPVLSLPELRVQ